MFRTLLFVILMAGAGLAHAEPQFPPGLRVGLEPAGDLKTGQGIAGFQDIDHKTTVTIAELPVASFGELSKAMFGEMPRGATNVARNIFSFRDGVGYLHEARTVENGAASKRWFFLAMPAGLKQPIVLLVKVSVPDAANKIYSDAAVRKMLASLTLRDPPIEEQLSLIPFKLNDLSGFRVASVTPESVLVIEGPDDNPSGRPYVIVTIGRATPAQLDDRARFSRDLLTHSPLRGLTPVSAEDMRISGTPGYEIRARAQDGVNNNISVVQWVRFVGGGFIRIVGVAPSEKWDEVFNRFRAVRDGVAFR